MRRSWIMSAAVVATAGLSAGADVIDFEGITAGTTLDGLTIGNATFTTSSLGGFLGDPAVFDDGLDFLYLNRNYVLGTAAAGNFIRIDFAQAVTDISFGFGGPIALPEITTANVTLYDDGGGVIAVRAFESDTNTPDLNGGRPGDPFVLEGLADLSDVTDTVSAMEIVFEFALPFSQSYKFDNLAFTPIPGPGSAVLLAAGIAAAARRRR